jgi:hypothetical protein
MRKAGGPLHGNRDKFCINDQLIDPSAAALALVPPTTLQLDLATQGRQILHGMKIAYPL